MNRLRETRKKSGFTQQEMASKIGISESYYCQLETGKRRMSLDNALKISSILGKTPDEIFLPNNMAKCKVSIDAASEQAATFEKTG